MKALCSMLLAAGLAVADHASARTAQVCPGPALPPTGCFTVDTSVIGGRAFEDFVVTRPGKLLVDVARRRNELARLDASTSALYCAVNPLAAEAPSLPAITSASVAVTVWESRWSVAGVEHVREYARVAFDSIGDSDGLTYPRFGLTFSRDREDRILRLEFFPSADANLVGIPGLTRDVYLNVDTDASIAVFQRLDDLPISLRRLLLGLAYRLPAILGAAASVNTLPGARDPLWTLQGVAQAAATFTAVGFGTPLAAFAPIPALTCDLRDVGATTCAEVPQLNAFRDAMIRYGADYVRSNDPAVRASIVSNLQRWAQANALTSYPGITVGAANQPDFRPKYELQWLLVPVIQTWSVVRADPAVSSADRTLIDGWLGRLVAYATEPFGGPAAPENPFNVGYLTRGLAMQWGVMTGSNVAIALGMEKVLMGLHQMRPDGSFPREVARGACAMRYQDTMLLNLVFLAELAATQGYDAYALSVDGKTLHTAIEFLLDAVDNPSLVLAYAGEDASNCTDATPPMDFSVVVDSPGGFSYSAWLEPYIARFPDHANAVRLRSLPREGLSASRPIFHPHSGGGTTCLYAQGSPAPITPPDTAVEYVHPDFGHYFVTAGVDELDTLDRGGFSGWQRSGEQFGIFPLGSPATAAVCRFFSAAFAPRSSHFYTAIGSECAAVKKNPDWQFEGEVFGMRLPDASGSCPANTTSLYRLYNDGRTGAPNHRYTTSPTVRAQMLGQGFVPEGAGAQGVVGCVPL